MLIRKLSQFQNLLPPRLVKLLSLMEEMTIIIITMENSHSHNQSQLMTNLEINLMRTQMTRFQEDLEDTDL